MANYHPPQIKNKELINYAYQFNINNSNSNGEEFVEYMIGKSLSSFTSKSSRIWSKDAFKALKYVRAMIMLNKPIPEISTLNESDFSDDGNTYVSYQDTNRMNRILRGSLNNTPNSKAHELSNTKTNNPDAPDIHELDDNIITKKKKKKTLKHSVENAEDELNNRFSLVTSTITVTDVIDGFPLKLVQEFYYFSWMRLTAQQKDGLSPRPTVLIRGPAGCGKSTLVKAMAGSLNVKLIKLSVSDILQQGGSGQQSSKLIKAIFQKAKMNSPSIIHLEDIDLFPTKVSKTGTSMCGVLKDVLESVMGSRVLLVVETTSHLAELDTSLLQLFTCKITFGMMHQAARLKILDHFLSKNQIKLPSDFGPEELARRTPGFEIGDLLILMTTLKDRLASQCVPFLSPILNDMESSDDKPISWMTATTSDLDFSLSQVVPIAKQVPGFVTVPDVTWSDIGGQEAAKLQIENNFLSIVNDSEAAAKLGRRSDGILLIGPPGCGKTLMAKALSNRAGLNFISVKGPEIFDKYLGESERKIRVIFERARACQPCLIFFDEIDAICSKRNDDSNGRTGVVNMLLTELDGLESRGTSSRVFIMAATNRLDTIDEAVLRAGRLGIHVNVSPPATVEERVAVLNALTRNGTFPQVKDKDKVFETIAADCRTHSFSGASFDSLLERAKQHAHVHIKQDYLSDMNLQWALDQLNAEELDTKLRKKENYRKRRLPPTSECEADASNRFHGKVSV